MAKLEIEWKDILLVSILSIIGCVHRVLFKRSYPIDADSYYFMQFAKDHTLKPVDFLSQFVHSYGISNTNIMLMLLFLTSILLFYFCCKFFMSEPYAFFSTLLFIFSPILYLNSYFFMIDKNIPTIAIFLFSFFIFMSEKEKLQKSYILPMVVLFGSCFIGYYIWVGFLYITAFYFIYCAYYAQKNDWILFSIFMIAAMPFIKPIINLSRYVLGSTDKQLISELLPIWYVNMYFEYVFIVIVYLCIVVYLKDKEFRSKYLAECLFLLYLMIGMILVFRTSLFALPIIFLFLGIIYEKVSKSIIVDIIAICLVCLLVITAIPMYILESPVLNANHLDAIKYLQHNSNSSCIIGSWDKGHFYGYYTNKTILYKAYAGLYREQSDYMIYGNKTNCSYIWDKNDIAALKLMDDKNTSVENYYLSNVSKITFGNGTKEVYVYGN